MSRILPASLILVLLSAAVPAPVLAAEPSPVLADAIDRAAKRLGAAPEASAQVVVTRTPRYRHRRPSPGKAILVGALVGAAACGTAAFVTSGESRGHYAALGAYTCGLAGAMAGMTIGR